MFPDLAWASGRRRHRGSFLRGGQLWFERGRSKSLPPRACYASEISRQARPNRTFGDNPIPTRRCRKSLYDARKSRSDEGTDRLREQRIWRRFGSFRIEWTFPLQMDFPVSNMDFPASNVDLRFLGVVASLRLSVCLSVNLSAYLFVSIFVITFVITFVISTCHLDVCHLSVCLSFLHSFHGHFEALQCVI